MGVPLGLELSVCGLSGTGILEFRVCKGLPIFVGVQGFTPPPQLHRGHHRQLPSGGTCGRRMQAGEATFRRTARSQPRRMNRPPLCLPGQSSQNKGAPGPHFGDQRRASLTLSRHPVCNPPAIPNRHQTHGVETGSDTPKSNKEERWCVCECVMPLCVSEEPRDVWRKMVGRRVMEGYRY